jgi:hypothetical protein
MNICSSSFISSTIVITNTTSSGAVWTIERTYTYGDISIAILLMALILVTVFDIILRLAVLRV